MNLTSPKWLSRWLCKHGFIRHDYDDTGMTVLREVVIDYYKCKRCNSPLTTVEIRDEQSDPREATIPLADFSRFVQQSRRLQ